MTSVVCGPTRWWMGSPGRISETIAKTGARLRATRRALGLSQRDAAKAAGVSEQRWSNWERGEHLLDVGAAMRFADRFRLTLDWLYRGDPAGLPFGLAERLLSPPRDADEDAA